MVKKKQNIKEKKFGEKAIVRFVKRKLPKEKDYEELEELIEKETEYEQDLIQNKKINSLNQIDLREDFEDEENDDGEFEDEGELKINNSELKKQQKYLAVDNQEVEESLAEIYQDDDGKMVDVKKLYVKKRKGFFFYFFSFIFFLVIFAGSGYYYYENFYSKARTDETAIDFNINSKSEVLVAEEFFYELSYKNNISVPINDARIEVKYPDNFVFIESEPKPLADKNSMWDLGTVENQHIGTIKIKGMLLGEKDKSSSILASLTYTPLNFSSNFKKETSFSTLIKDTGIDIDFDTMNTALVGSENEINIKYRAKSNNFIKDFRLVFEPQENIKIVGLFNDDDKENIDIETIRPGVWQINNINNETQNLIFKFDFLDKKEDKQKLVFNLEKKQTDDKYFTFYKQELEFDVMKSDLNLTMIINGSKENQGINFGDTLNYSIVYNNKGETAMQNVVVMAVLDSPLIDWDSLVDDSSGIVNKNTITWTKEHISALGQLEKHAEGTIDFSIKLVSAEQVEIKEGENYEVTSYSQFSVAKTDLAEEKDDKEKVNENKETNNRSNTIVNKINSNLGFKEIIRYFNEDNIPVGTGPHPPEVGKKTTYRVYWNLTNSLNELNDLKIETILPQNISWAGREQFSTGSVLFDEVSKKVVWSVGRLPKTVSLVDAYFDIAVDPQEDDRDKIMILLNGSSVSASDKETEAKIEISSRASTSKLEGDDIATGDGVVK